jgi:hypothetical protein
MCHSVEIYMPTLARRAAEHRLGSGAGSPARGAVPGLRATALGQSALKVDE